MRILITMMIAFALTGCNLFLLDKEQREDKRANRKLEKLTEKYPQLVTKDTLRDTVEVIVPEIHIETIFETSKDVSGVDSILGKFGDRIDSLTALKLGDEIKYYITNRTIIEDTIVHQEDGVTVKIWQNKDGNLAFSVDKPEEVIEAPVEIAYDRIAPVEENWFEKAVTMGSRYGFLILLIMLIIWGVRKLYKMFY